MEWLIILAIIIMGGLIILGLMFASIARIRYDDALEYLDDDE